MTFTALKYYMINYSRSILFILTFSLLTVLVKGQQQIRVNDDIAEKFRKYCRAVPWEEIYVHTDRDGYIAGEEIWFKIYLVDRENSKPSDGSSIVYCELLNPDNRPVAQKRIKIEDGSGPGMIIIPDTVRTGEYTLRAYTNRMKNFLPENCFLKELNIYNAISSLKIAGTGNRLPSESDQQNSMVVAQTGFEAEVNNSGPAMLEIMVRTNDDFRSENGNHFYLFIHTHGIIDLNRTERFTGDTTRISVPKELLTPGINHITFFSAGEQPLFERFVYTPSDHGRYLTLDSPERTGTRNKIVLDVEPVQEFIPSSENVDLSISVAPATNRHTIPDITDYLIFGSEFGILPSEIRKRRLSELSPEITDGFLKNAKSNWINWRVILSGEFPDIKYKMEKEDHFLTGKLINRDSRTPDSARYVFLSMPGKVAGFQYSKTDKEGNFSFNTPISQAVKDIIIQPEEPDRNNVITIMSSFSEEYLAREDPSGNIEKEVPYVTLTSGINYQVRKIYGTSSVGDTLEEISSLPELKRFYGKPDIELIMDDYIKLPVMQEVFYELMPGVYLKNRKSQYEISIAGPVQGTVYPRHPGLFIDGVVVNDPAVIANLDPELVEKIDAAKKEYMIGDYLFYGLVNVITRAGDYSNVNLPDYAVSMPCIVTEPVNSFSSPDYSSGENIKSRIPDFRNTLYWNPSLKPDAGRKIRIEFWASDFISDYIINIQGLTSEGKPISYSKSISIK